MSQITCPVCSEEGIEIPQPTLDALWGAFIFEEKGRWSTVSGAAVLMVNGRPDSSTPGRLQRLFGGAVYPFGSGTVRWQVTGDVLLSFLDAIHPHLTDDGLEKEKVVRAFAAGLDAQRLVKRKYRKRQEAEKTPPEPPKVDAFTLMPGIDPDQLELVLGGFAVNSEGKILLRAVNADHAQEWKAKLLGYDQGNVKVLSVGIEYDVLIDVMLLRRKEA